MIVAFVPFLKYVGGNGDPGLIVAGSIIMVIGLVLMWIDK